MNVTLAKLARAEMGTWRHALCIATTALGCVIAGCATPHFPPAPRDAATSDYEYLIGPLDGVSIIVWRNPELSMSVEVRPDGKLTTPLVNDLPAIGKTPTGLARDIEQALSKYIRDPVVTVVVTRFAGPITAQIRIVGEATKPQILAYRQDLTLLDVMIAVGGLTDFADGNRASIFRTADGGTGKSYSVRLRDLVKGGDITANVDMRPGDILIIPQSWF